MVGSTPSLGAVGGIGFGAVPFVATVGGDEGVDPTGELEAEEPAENDNTQH